MTTEGIILVCSYPIVVIGVSLSLTYLNLNALIKRFNTVSKCSIAKKTLKCSIKYMSKISIMVFKYTTVKKEAEI